jgi:predicted transcriptional regulator
MEVLWTQPDTDLRGRAVADKLPEYAYTTVATVLDRLSRKGEVHRTTDGRVHLYRATGTAGTHTAKAMHDALDRADDPGEALTHFVRLMPSDQLEALRRALKSRR